MSRKMKGQVKISRERMYDVVRKPIITEKSTMASEHGQVAFQVAIDATKPEIKAAVEGLFGVKVKAVNTLRQKGKVKMFRGKKGKRVNVKKAMITLEEGQNIDAEQPWRGAGRPRRAVEGQAGQGIDRRLDQFRRSQQPRPHDGTAAWRRTQAALPGCRLQAQQVRRAGDDRAVRI
jgi:large subunit ribosomal protein L23